MKILIVSQYFWPEFFRINEVAAYLQGQGHDVTVLTGLPNYPSGEVFPAFQKSPNSFANFKGSKIVRVPHTLRKKGRMWLFLNYLTFALSASILGMYKLRGKEFDVIIAVQLSPATAVLPAVFLRRSKRAPLAIWVLDLWPESLEAVNAIKSRFVLSTVGALVAFMYQRSELILAQSRAFERNLMRRSGSLATVKYFPTWAESEFESVSTELFSEIQAFHRGITIVFAGNIGDAQDFPAILDAAEKLRDRRDVRWLIIGDGRAADYVRIEIEQRKLSENMRMLGSFPTNRMPGLYAQADALLVTLKSDPVFSQTIPGRMQNCLKAGKPILAMIDGEGATLVEEADAGLVCCAGDSVGLARNVIKLAEMPISQRKAMGQNAKAYASREFDRLTILSKLEHSLASLSYGRRGAQ